MATIIEGYFPHLTNRQKEQFDRMLLLYPEWNARINVISRKDIDNLEVNHILHALSIAKYIDFRAGTRIMDFGTGGGIPGLQLAVMFPDSRFLLVDRTAKKLKVAEDIAAQCGLDNIELRHGDVAEVKEKFDFVVSRAVMPQTDLARICRKNISSKQNNALPNGLITLKGGELAADLGKLAPISEQINISQWFKEPFFETKKVVYTPIV